MDEQIASVLERRFPERDVAEVKPSGPSWNDQNRTVGIDFADGETIFLKMSNGGDGSRIARERAAIDYVGEKRSVPVPRVVASDTEGDVPYLATESVSGRNFLHLWSDASMARRATLARQVGESLASVHALRFENHGHIGGGGATGLELETGSWTDVLIDTIYEMREIASSNRFDHHFDGVVSAVEANRELLDEAPAALLHGDPAKPNCFGTENGIGFLDWEIAHVGDPVRNIYRTRNLQFGSLRADAPEEIASAFYDGYRERADGFPPGFEARRPVYAAVRFLAHAGVFDKWAAFLDESSDELAEWMDGEMERRLAEID
ncbi:phosphotransferase family protein [Haladaptatus pallidirubidus]|uniref:Aminoglycoside phosphotransferase domain-containing protein n=1 Tax=Haladaptatus pallidirubidus TaxID=1008152 RepID=A0AAV3UMM2_9EURY|nr:phosphotransferase [Haladaptatus pallidirubidus]